MTEFFSESDYRQSYLYTVHVRSTQAAKQDFAPQRPLLHLDILSKFSKSKVQILAYPKTVSLYLQR